MTPTPAQLAGRTRRLATIQRNINQRWKEYAETLGFSSEYAMLHTLYQEWTSYAIADLLGVSANVVGRHCREAGVVMRPRFFSTRFRKWRKQR